MEINTMKSKVIGALAATTMFFASAAFAQMTFYQSTIRDWSIMGKPRENQLNPSCSAEVKYQDGSFFTLLKDLADGELYILFRNVQWNISDDPGNYQMRINFYNGNRVVSLDAVYELLNKNTLRIRGINPERFLPLFVDFSRMLFIMPGNIQNAQVSLTGTSAVVAAMSECMRQYKPARPGINL
jgi:hypothetical protein